tara:strand:- start:331 stop:501 length:171 start_codon:yes stop_codon:yes gene_type:complete
MATHNLRATQKIIKLGGVNNKEIDSLNKRMETMETALNLILKKLDRIEKSNNTEIA